MVAAIGRVRRFLFDLAPGGVCLARPVTRPAGELLPHRFTLTSRTEARRGGLLSVALSLASRPVGVTHHRVLRSPDFPLAGAVNKPVWRLYGGAGQRPPGPLRCLDQKISATDAVGKGAHREGPVGQGGPPGTRATQPPGVHRNGVPLEATTPCTRLPPLRRPVWRDHCRGPRIGSGRTASRSCTPRSEW